MTRRETIWWYVGGALLSTAIAVVLLTSGLRGSPTAIGAWVGLIVAMSLNPMSKEQHRGRAALGPLTLREERLFHSVFIAGAAMALPSVGTLIHAAIRVGRSEPPETGLLILAAALTIVGSLMVTAATLIAWRIRRTRGAVPAPESAADERKGAFVDAAPLPASEPFPPARSDGTPR